MLTRAIEHFDGLGARTCFVDLSGVSVSEACERLAKIARRCARNAPAHGNALLACDNVPSCDEAEAEDLVRVFRQIVSTGTRLLVSLLPEGEVLAEVFGEACCYWSCNIASPRPEGGDELLAYDRFTKGVPRLCVAYEAVAPDLGGDPFTDPVFQEAYLDVVDSVLRPTLMGEERLLRAALLLLGSGDLSDARDLLGVVDADLWRLLSRDAPLFGLDAVTDTFRCVGCDSSAALSLCQPMIASVLSHTPRLVGRAAAVLADRGELSRARLAMSLVPMRAERCAFALRWSADFMEHGEVEVVREAMQAAREQGWSDLAGLVESQCLAFALLGQGGVDAHLRRVGSADSAPAATAALALGCRGLLQRLGEGASAAPPRPANALQERLGLLERMLWHIMRGDVSEARTLALSTPDRLSEPSVSVAVICVGYLLSTLLVGAVPDDEEVLALREADAFVEVAGLHDMRVALSSMVSLGLTLGGSDRLTHSFERDIHRADRYGDRILQGLYMMAEGVRDLRARTYAHSHVRLRQAAGLFDGANARYYACVARLFDSVVRMLLDARVSRYDLQACEGGSPTLDRVVSMVGAAIGETRSRRFSAPGGRPCPQDVHWVVNILVNDCREVSAKVRRVMPKAWLMSVRRGVAEVDAFGGRLLAEGYACDTGALRTRDREPVDVTALDPGAASRVQIRLLGGFDVRIDGVSPGAQVFERRRAKSVLALLASVPGHTLKRFTIMESVWPEYDFATANRCLYAATTVLRAETSGRMGAEVSDVVTSNKTERTLSLDPEFVWCDVDEFERVAHEILDGRCEDRRIVTLCRIVEDLYRGKLFVPPTDGDGIVASRARELNTLYADAMVVGADAALRVGSGMLACRFAAKAHEADDLREDAVKALVSALCAVGRHVEADRCYESYVSHVVDVTKRPPSRDLREAVDNLSIREARRSGGRLRRVQRAMGEQQAAGQLALDLGDV